MSSLVLMILFSLVVILGGCKRSPKTIEVEVEVSDPMTVEKIRNLYEEQDIYNAKISLLTKQNEQYEQKISQIKERIQGNIDFVRTQIRVQPNANIDILKANCEQINKELYDSKLKLENMVLTNSEKIVSYKKKSNTISERITKIGMEVYKQQRM